MCVYAATGFDTRVRSALDRLTHLWIRTGGGDTDGAGRREWRLALEGFGTCEEFAQACSLFRRALEWQSVTPFLSTGHLKRTSGAHQVRGMLEHDQPVEGSLAEASGYPREVRRLLQRRGMLAGALVEQTQVQLLPQVEVQGASRRPLRFHRFRSSGRETYTDAHGVFLRLRFPEVVTGPVALGYGCHFGLGLFAASEDRLP